MGSTILSPNRRQPVPNAANISDEGMAREAGYPSTHFYDGLSQPCGYNGEWRHGLLCTPIYIHGRLGTSKKMYIHPMLS